MKITIFGTGYVGLVTGACLANLGHTVLCMDTDEHKIKNLDLSGEIPFYEPGLGELVAKNKDQGRLSFTTDAARAVAFGDIYFNCVGTPNREDGFADLQYVFAVTETVAKYAQGYKILINKSTVPPGTARRCMERITFINKASEVEVVSNPEFLKEGSAVHDFTHPDKVVVGALSERAFEILRELYSGLVRPYNNLLETTPQTAEMIKYANNSFLATKISFINEIANICDHVGADVKDVARALGMDYRISPKFLNAGIGYGGSCFPKDIRAIVHTARSMGYEATFLQEVDLFNRRQKTLMVRKVTDRFGESLLGKSFALLGLSFKPKTNDIREATSLIIIQALLDRGARVTVYDPVSLSEVRAVFGESITYCSSLYEAAKGADALLLVTEWDEFRTIDFDQLGNDMAQKIIFDGRNIYDPALVKERGFEYIGIGRG